MYLPDETEASRQTTMLSEVVECRGMIISSPVLCGNNTTKTLVPVVLKLERSKTRERIKPWAALYSELRDAISPL